MGKGLSPELLRRPGTHTQTIDHSAHSRLEHGEKTWTTGQLARDILQNHLDAQSEQFFVQILARVLIEPMQTETPGVDELGEALWRFKKYFEPTDPVGASAWLGRECRRIFTVHAPALPQLLRPEFRERAGIANIPAIIQEIQPLQEELPRISFQVVDTQREYPRQWVSYTDIQQPPYIQRERFPIVGWSIEDAGDGFDAKLQSLYQPTKRAKPYLRGRFGEGMKMSHLHALRHNTVIKTRSSYIAPDGMHHLWQSHPFGAPDRTLHVRGVEVTRPHAPIDRTGSLTILTFEESDLAFQEELRAEIDPRVNGLSENCLELSERAYRFYPAEPAVGVSLETTPDHQYVQGLRLPEPVSASATVLYSYNFLDAKILAGRDRKNVGRLAEEELRRFWTQAATPELLQDCVRRVCGIQSSGRIVEEEALSHILRPFSPDEEKKKDAARRCIEACQAVLGLQQNTDYLLVTDMTPADVRRMATATHVGLIEVQHLPDFDLLHALNYQLKTDHIVLYDQPTFLEEAGGRHQEQPTLDTSEQMFQEEVRHVFTATCLGVEAIIRSLGLNPASVRINRNPRFQVVGASDSRPHISLMWDKRIKQFTFVCSIPEGGVGSEEAHVEYIMQLRRLIELYLIACIDRQSPLSHQREILEKAQSTIDRWHTRSLQGLHPDLARLPTDFAYTRTKRDIAAEVNPLKAREVARPQDQASWEMLRAMRAARHDPDRLARLLPQIQETADPYRRLIEDEARLRIHLTAEELIYVGPDFQLAQHRLTELEGADQVPRMVGHLSDGRPVIQYRRGGYGFPIDIPNGSVITYTKKDKVGRWVYYQQELYTFSSSGSREPVLRPYYPRVHDPFAVNPTSITWDSSDTDALLEQAEHLAGRFHVQPPDSDRPVQLEMLAGVLESPVTKDFGQEAWDNPVRLVQDIVQNHVDAAQGKAVSILFEVQRGQSTQWIRAADIHRTDEIIGIEIQDTGSGYAPDHINVVGDTSKMSPLFAGKYGEGQKMVAAAAVRHGLDLIYTSAGEHQGERYRWQARAAGAPVSVVAQRKRIDTDRVVFQVSSHREEGSEYTSATRIRLPKAVSSEAAKKLWGGIVDIVDPRKTDTNEHAGIARYIRYFRKPQNTVIDMGYMKILLDEPGVIYENGLKIETGIPLTVGYDVPAITSTRERNLVDRERLEEYIQSAYSECPDPRFARILVDQFFHSTWNRIQNKALRDVQELDQRWGLPFSYYGQRFLLSRPLWDAAVSRHNPEVFVHSEDYCENVIRHSTSPEEVMGAHKAQQAASRMPKHNILHVDDSGYRALSNFFSTSVEVGAALSQHTVECSPTTARVLAQAVAAEANLLRVWMDETEELRVGDSVGRLHTWTNVDEIYERRAVVLSPVDAMYAGSASVQTRRIALNESLLSWWKRPELGSTIQHELIHDITQRPDFDPEFLQHLLSLIRFNVRRHSLRGKVMRAAENFIREE